MTPIAVGSDRFEPSGTQRHPIQAPRPATAPASQGFGELLAGSTHRTTRGQIRVDSGRERDNDTSVRPDRPARGAKPADTDTGTMPTERRRPGATHRRPAREPTAPPIRTGGDRRARADRRRSPTDPTAPAARPARPPADRRATPRRRWSTRQRPSSIPPPTPRPATAVAGRRPAPRCSRTRPRERRAHAPPIRCSCRCPTRRRPTTARRTDAPADDGRRRTRTAGQFAAAPTIRVRDARPRRSPTTGAGDVRTGAAAAPTATAAMATSSPREDGTAARATPRRRSSSCRCSRRCARTRTARTHCGSS